MSGTCVHAQANGNCEYHGVFAERDRLRTENVALREVLDSIEKRTHKMWPEAVANALLFKIHHDAGEALKVVPETAKVAAALDATGAETRAEEECARLLAEAAQGHPSCRAVRENVARQLVIDAQERRREAVRALKGESP